MFNFFKKKPVEVTTDDNLEPEIDKEEMFNKNRVACITFSVDRLPYLKNLLAAYEEEEKKLVALRRRYTELEQKLEPISREISYKIESGWNDTGRHLPNSERVLRILCRYSGDLLTKLEKLRDKGWDGKGLSYGEDYSKLYRCDAINRLRALVSALEAGNSEATLNIPKEFASEYEVWLTSHIAWAVNTGKGPAGENK